MAARLSQLFIDFRKILTRLRRVGLDRSRPAFQGISPKHCTLPAQRAKAIGEMIMPSNVLLLYVARGVRGFGDGFATIILPAYLTAIGYSPVQIGFVATASLPSAFLSLTATFNHPVLSSLLAAP